MFENFFTVNTLCVTVTEDKLFKSCKKPVAMG